ncbi:arsenate reductase (glutaredoxin) [Sphingomonas sp. CFBP 13720]|uniref:arsenate reductase (glutaredoxin) n=1 Tax=Sphingomonas sp. CFBP 13720 TaxID=2775302 RepID=UPI0017824103|nr:arsenate reductase (glutaredoxin) [Sphingomonas sp. CFBP 13720]MBD8677739.1 arsenate reductase (glutaredoxin) [Sphingomonas sp. CFBP 13720]
MQATIYHNPRCSKSRAALALLRAADADVTIVEYLKTPPDRTTLAALLARGGLGPRDVLRRTEPGAAALTGADDAAILDAMLADPILMERPLVATARGVVLARPPERVADIL